jgi:acetyl-CoA carboxylase biotin carboxylase subunit
MFNKVLVANRGEIAVRVMNALRELSIPSVAVFSTIDRESIHVLRADEAVCLGDPPPSESYLNMERVLSATESVGADAIHPGYGFLAENSEFARLCEERGITFIGPSSDAIALLGNKLESRKRMSSGGIPVIPGMTAKEIDEQKITQEARNIGYPVLVKASGGGGGKGIKIVHDDDALLSAVESAQREAKAAFGDETVYLEKYLTKCRHVEIQVFADRHGNAVHLFERECSVQRRHQKVIEERPSTALDEALRAKMGEAAVEVARLADYVNAGTVEFLLDSEGKFYFLEVNTRIQVEHPVTEMTTGVDLVAEQVRVAAGEKLSFVQGDIVSRGHAIECRIYAEDPEQNFLPAPGTVLLVKEPTGPGVRHDSGIYSGWDVSTYYDPILSKLICWGPDRESARKRMICALEDLVILGVRTPKQFLRYCLEHPDFIAGDTFTDFIDNVLPGWQEQEPPPGRLEHALTAAAVFSRSRKASPREGEEPSFLTPWERLGRWRLCEE